MYKEENVIKKIKAQHYFHGKIKSLAIRIDDRILLPKIIEYAILVNYKIPYFIFDNIQKVVMI